MKHLDFPIISYDKNEKPQKWGQRHGEEFRSGIKEVLEIRKNLMLQKNPALKSRLDELSKAQFEITQRFSQPMADELLGIQEGSGLSLSDIVIINNYTDFRDIDLPEEGCSAIAYQGDNGLVLGQTWDMHSSAKKYLCVIKAPLQSGEGESLIFSIVGCLGLMGISTTGQFVGVNNINTIKAKAGLIWPALVRHLMEVKNHQEMITTLDQAPVTSGHNYLLSDGNEASQQELSPSGRFEAERVTPSRAYSFHTNHCLSDLKKEEVKTISPTTMARYSHLEKLLPNARSFQDGYEILTSHEGYPKSICSHYDNGSADPSQTCGGGLLDYSSKKIHLWRGCPTYDQTYKEYKFQINDHSFKEI